MKKGQKKRIWTKEQKLEIIGKHLNEHISDWTLEKEYNADRSMICYWVRDYRKYSENIKFPNTVKGNCNTTKPLEIVVSDMKFNKN